jgi:hypothetical protein
MDTKPYVTWRPAGDHAFPPGLLTLLLNRLQDRTLVIRETEDGPVLELGLKEWSLWDFDLEADLEDRVAWGDGQ